MLGDMFGTDEVDETDAEGVQTAQQSYYYRSKYIPSQLTFIHHYSESAALCWRYGVTILSTLAE